MSDQPAVVERVTTARGELVLRQVGTHFEIVSNGTFLMDTRGGDSERLLVTAALDARPAAATVLIGGLGVGFSLVAALDDPRIEQVVVVEVEPVVVDWHRGPLAACSHGVLDDPRVSIVVADIADHLASAAAAYDVICLDVDNGPDWTVTDSNRDLYGDAGTRMLAARLTRGGVLAVWSAARSPEYERTLHRHFAHVQVHEVAVQRGQPDVVMVGISPYL